MKLSFYPNLSQFSCHAHTSQPPARRFCKIGGQWRCYFLPLIKWNCIQGTKNVIICIIICKLGHWLDDAINKPSIYSLLTKSFAWYLHVQLCLKPSSNSKQFSCHKPIQYLSNDIIEKKNWQKMICIIYLIALESCGKVHFQIKRSWENSPLTLYCPPFHTMWRGRGRILALFPTYGDFHWTWKDTIKVQNSKEFKV